MHLQELEISGCCLDKASLTVLFEYLSTRCPCLRRMEGSIDVTDVKTKVDLSNETIKLLEHCPLALFSISGRFQVSKQLLYERFKKYPNLSIQVYPREDSSSLIVVQRGLGGSL